MIRFILGLAIVIILIVCVTCIMVGGIKELGTKVKAEYLKPDTTITIKNGRPDTVIVKKSQPWWLK